MSRHAPRSLLAAALSTLLLGSSVAAAPPSSSTARVRPALGPASYGTDLGMPNGWTANTQPECYYDVDDTYPVKDAPGRTATRYVLSWQGGYAPLDQVSPFEWDPWYQKRQRGRVKYCFQVWTSRVAGSSVTRWATVTSVSLQPYCKEGAVPGDISCPYLGFTPWGSWYFDNPSMVAGGGHASFRLAFRGYPVKNWEFVDDNSVVAGECVDIDLSFGGMFTFGTGYRACKQGDWDSWTEGVESPGCGSSCNAYNEWRSGDLAGLRSIKMLAIYTIPNGETANLFIRWDSPAYLHEPIEVWDNRQHRYEDRIKSTERHRVIKVRCVTTRSGGCFDGTWTSYFAD